MSMGFLTPPGVAASWRGPMLISAVNQLLFGVKWNDVDVLVIDLPPGTGDTQISLVQTVQLTGAILVSTPQQLALEDVKRGMDLFKKCNVTVIIYFVIIDIINFLKINIIFIKLRLLD